MSSDINPKKFNYRPANAVQFMLQICVAVLALIFANMLTARMSGNSVPRQILHRIDADHDVTLLAAGNSLMAVAFSEQTFRDAWISNLTKSSIETISPMNVALGASSPVEHLLLLRRALASQPQVKTVVYGFFDLQLTDKPLGGWADMTGNRAMSYYVEPKFAANVYAPGSRLQQLQVAMISRAPMLVERLALWAKVEKLRRSLGGLGLPAERATALGRAADFKSLEIGDIAHYENLCNGCIEQRVPLTPSIQMMADEITGKNATLVIIEMPMTIEHRNTYYSTSAFQAYKQYVEHLLSERHCRFIDASEWIPDANFVDDLHLGDQGRDDFTKRLAKELKAMPGVGA